MKNKNILFFTSLSLIITLSISFSASAEPRADFWTDSGTYYDFYLDWMYPKRDVGPKPASANIKQLTVKVKPRADFYTDSGAYYDFYLDWMYPKGKNRPADVGVLETVTVKPKPRTDFYTDSGAYYDFYLDWMYPKRSKPESRRTIKFLTRDRGVTSEGETRAKDNF